MRNPERLYDFYDKIRDIHMERFSDWRFGQLCSNFFGWLLEKRGIDIFFPEEDKMLEYLEEYAEEVTGNGS